LDTRRVGRVVRAACLVALAAATVIFFVSGLHKNNQITQLRQHGVPVRFTVSGCLGLLGGSGSNEAGYSCKGSFILDGHRYQEPIPGNSLHRPGSVLQAVTVPGDPALVITVHMLDGEHTSGTVYIVPGILLAILLGLLGTLVVRRRRRLRA
jgi:hypothetical protein